MQQLWVRLRKQLRCEPRDAEEFELRTGRFLNLRGLDYKCIGQYHDIRFYISDYGLHDRMRS